MRCCWNRSKPCCERRELQAHDGVPTLHIDNSAAGGLLGSSAGSWRTRHLRFRFSYAVERVARGCLRTAHTPGELQLADLPTKLHPRARLLDLLRHWNMCALPELDQRTALRMATLVVVLCAVMAAQTLLGVEAAKVPGLEKEPLEVAGAWELSFILMLSCCVAVVCWEAVKALRSSCVRRLFSTNGLEVCLQRLREFARLAAEAEIERQWSGASEAMDGALHSQVQQAVDTALGRSAGTWSIGIHKDPRHTECAASPPRPERELQPRMSPGAHSVQSATLSVNDDVLQLLDRERLCRDAIMLMSCDSIRQGLCIEARSLSGLKPDLAARWTLRLVPHEGFAVTGRVSPSDNQLRYTLCIWKHRRLQTRCTLVWQDMTTREGISHWINN